MNSSISRPITICHDKFFVQKAGRHWLLYDGPTGGFVNDFPSWERLVEFVTKHERKKK